MKLRLVGMAIALSLLLVIAPGRSAIAASSQPSVELDASAMGPREIEELTEKKIIRDYAEAWKSLGTAMEGNRPGLVSEYFTGFAKAALTKAVADQAATGIHRRYEDRGHKLEGLFYSQDGGVMQLRDTASYEVQVFDGDKLLYTQPTRETFVVILTPAADRWMVRLLQGEPHS